MNQKHIGFWLIFAGVLVGIVTGVMKASYDAQTEMIIERNGGSCFVNETVNNENTVKCLHDPVKLIPFLGGGLLALTLCVFGAYLIFISKKQNQIEKDVPVHEKKEINKNISSLGPEEKKAFDLIKEAQGTIFQSELVEKTGFTKVKVTRILDKLEGKGLIDRRRRGMTNVVILKN